MKSSTKQFVSLTRIILPSERIPRVGLRRGKVHQLGSNPLGTGFLCRATTCRGLR